MILYILSVVAIAIIMVLCFTGVVESIFLAPIIGVGVFLGLVLLWCFSAFIYTRSIDLKKEYDEPVAEKYRWLARYFNRTIHFEEGHSHMEIENELL